MYRTWIGILLAVPLPCFAQTADEKKASIAYVRALQHPDGGFVPSSDKAKAGSSLRATSAAARALKYFGGELPDKAKAAEFVGKCWVDDVGGFADVPGGKPDVALTAVGLMAAKELGLSMDNYKEKAVRYLVANAKTFDEVRIAVAGLEVLGPPAKLLDDETRRDWTFIAVMEPDSDQPFMIGSKVVAAMRMGFEPAQAQRMAAQLAAAQNSDGGYAKPDQKTSDLEATYRIMRALYMIKTKPKEVDKLKGFIAKCRNTDGGYGIEPGKPSAMGSTYYAAIILHWLDAK